MSATQHGDILFGVEIEFHVEVPRDSRSLSRRNAEARKALALTLAQRTRLPIACQCTHGLGNDTCAVCEDAPASLRFNGGRVIHHLTHAETADFQPRYQYFYVQPEGLADSTFSHEVVRAGMEISTPVFHHSELNAGLPKLSQVISTLGQFNLKVIGDEACGLHIHVGLQNGMTLLFSKKAVTIVLLLERALLRALLPESRCDIKWAAPIIEQSFVAKRGMSQHWIEDALKRPCSSMATHVTFTRRNIQPGAWNASNPEEFYKTLRLFWQAESLDDMQTFLSKNGSSKLALALVLRGYSDGDDLEGSSSTMEFRYPQMNFHLPFIRNWAGISCRIGEIAKLDTAGFRTKAKDILNVLNANSGNQNLWENLLTVIGLETQIPEWRDQLRRYDLGEDLIQCTN